MFRVAGFFTGVGGIELGFKQAGFEIAYSNDFDEKAAETFKANFGDNIQVKDIAQVDANEIPDVDVFCGGFPCQAFSVAGLQKGFADERGELFFQFARIIEHKKPRIVFAENVKNLKTHDKGNTFKTISQTLENFGYVLKTDVLNACEYGNVPQNRERIYIIGFLNPADYENYQQIQPIPLTTTISDIIEFDRKVDSKYYYTKDQKLYNELAGRVVRSDTVYQWRRNYLRENKSNMCPTLVANMGTGGHNVPIVLAKHGIRKLTPRECFRFQGFPDSFVLPKIADGHLYKQAGNSVCVPVVRRLAEAIRNAMETTDKSC